MELPHLGMVQHCALLALYLPEGRQRGSGTSDAVPPGTTTIPQRQVFHLGAGSLCSCQVTVLVLDLLYPPLCGGVNPQFWLKLHS